MQQEVMNYDVLIVGAGPAGLSAAIKLKQLAQKDKKEISVCILEKGAEIGSHILSGAVLEPGSLKALLPERWKEAPLDMPVSEDDFYFLRKNGASRLPTPPQMKNDGNYIISLGQLCRFLGQEAEVLGCEIFPGFPASEIIYNDAGEVIGVETGSFGIDKNDEKTANYQPGMPIHAKQVLFAEGCRGQLSQELMARYHLREKSSPQTYGIGFKEIWRIDASQHQAGKVVHTIGWPLDNRTYGGSFIYHASDQQLFVGFVVGLDYKNPWMSPFEEFQRFKTHPLIKPLLEGAERLAYGSRALNEGGWQSLPKLSFPGGLLMGDAAGFVNVPKIKGIHNAMQSGMIAAEHCFNALENMPAAGCEIKGYDAEIKSSSIGKELYQVRNIRPGFKYGLFFGLLNAAFETYITRGKSPWTFTNHADHLSLSLAEQAKKISYPKPDNKISFDRTSSVYLSNTFHEENQPCHLHLKDPRVAIDINLKKYASPETRYCPAGVYEIVETETGSRLQINAQNCLHCKSCDIKDPSQNIVWRAPEGGGGPNYLSM